MKLPDPSITALIALSGVIGSAMISWAVAVWQNKILERRLIREISHKYNERLYAIRLQVYPGLYLCLSKLGKKT
jgi:hypothetical protein